MHVDDGREQVVKHPVAQDTAEPQFSAASPPSLGLPWFLSIKPIAIAA